jgi:hypothetical protein
MMASNSQAIVRPFKAALDLRVCHSEGFIRMVTILVCSTEGLGIVAM